MAKGKPAKDPLQAYRNLQEVLKKVKIIGNDFTVYPGDIITFKRKGVESIVKIQDDFSLGGYMSWMFSTCEKFFSDIKNNNIKVKGTTVEDLVDCVNIYKDMELMASYEKLGYDFDTNAKMAMSYYKYLPNFLDKILDTSSLGMSGWQEITQTDIESLFDGDVISLSTGRTDGVGSSCYIGLELLPLLKDNTDICYTFCGPLSKGAPQHTFALREVYPEAIVYTLGAFIDI